jgi:hypothetical protein
MDDVSPHHEHKKCGYPRKSAKEMFPCGASRFTVNDNSIDNGCHWTPNFHLLAGIAYLSVYFIVNM